MGYSFKKMAAEGKIKKADLYRVRLEDLTVEEGFNLRDDNSALEEHIESLTESILAGAYVPPLVVRIDDEGKVVVVDGHCRRQAYLRAVKRGAQIEYVSAEAFRGNDADRVLTVITSSQGQALKPLETARGFKRLRNFGWTTQQIASATGRTYSGVESLLVLADAPSSVHKAVQDDVISASSATELVRKHGDKTAAVIEKMLGDAPEPKKEGAKKRVTPAMVSNLPPRRVLAGVYENARAIREGLPSTTLWRLQADQVSGTVEIEASALKALLDAVGEAPSRSGDDDAADKA